MQRDYYAFRQAELSDSLDALERAYEAREVAKDANDRTAREQAEDQMKQAAEKAVKIEPHLAYLWYQAHNSELDNFIRDAWQRRLAVVAAQQAHREHFDFRKLPDAFRFVPDPDISNVAHLPRLSFLLHIPFRLQKPYLSKDERDFYLLDNPLRREKVFQTPMVASTGWKGALRAALWQLGCNEEHEVTIRLLGNPRGSEKGQAGRLHFFPTFFDAIGLEVINPHDRKTGVGARGPILMECVPQGTTGKLVLLNVPFGLLKQSEDEKRAQVAQDLEVLAKGIQAMLTTYGFGAKTSSGYGTAEDRLAGEGKLLLRADLPVMAAQAPAEPQPEPASDLPRYLESPKRLIEALRRTDGTLKSEEEYKVFIENQGRKYGKKDRQLYGKAKRWWEREGQALMEAASQESESEPEPSPPETPPVAEYTFRTLNELCQVAQQVAEELRKGGAS